MSASKGFLRFALGTVLLATLSIAMAVTIRWSRKVFDSINSSPLATNAYPSPEGSETRVLLQLEFTPGPPEFWPTNLPWPPQNTHQTIPTYTGSFPFPTPAFLPVTGDRPEYLSQIWYPHFHSPSSFPELRVVRLDEQSQPWEIAEQKVYIAIPRPIPGPDPGPVLTDLFMSPDQRWLVSNFVYVGSKVLDLTTGNEIPLMIDGSKMPWKFRGWANEGKGIVAQLDDGLALINLDTSMGHTIELFNMEDRPPSIRAVAYSPDHAILAYESVFPATFGVRDFELTEIELLTTETGEIRSLAKIEAGLYVVENSLIWSPDGGKLAWIVVVNNPGGELEAQLWMADFSNNSIREIYSLGKSVYYEHPAIWLPDGSGLIFIKVEEARESKDYSGNVYLLELASGNAIQLSNFTGFGVSHLAISPDRKWVGFTVTRGDYGEIWVSNLEGTRQFPVAGPTLPRAPFVWVPFDGK